MRSTSCDLPAGRHGGSERNSGGSSPDLFADRDNLSGFWSVRFLGIHFKYTIHIPSQAMTTKQNIIVRKYNG